MREKVGAAAGGGDGGVGGADGEDNRRGAGAQGVFFVIRLVGAGPTPSEGFMAAGVYFAYQFIGGLGEAVIPPLLGQGLQVMD